VLEREREREREREITFDAVLDGDASSGEDYILSGDTSGMLHLRMWNSAYIW
jgi:hypothetical protein